MSLLLGFGVTARNDLAQSVLCLCRWLRLRVVVVSVEFKVTVLERDVATVGDLRRHVLERVNWPLLVLFKRLLVSGCPLCCEARPHSAQVAQGVLLEVLLDKRAFLSCVLHDALGEPVVQPLGKAMLPAKVFESWRLDVQRSDELDGCVDARAHAPLVLDLGLGVRRRDDGQVVTALERARLAERVVEH